MRITSGQGITSGQPVSMQQGRLVVFTSHPHIGWLNLESGDGGIYRTSPAFGATFAKLDENRLLVDSLDLTDPTRSNPWVFDITRQVVAPVDPAGMQGLLIPTGDRPGFMRRGQSAWVADTVKTTSEPVSLDKVAGEYELQVQLAKLKAQVDLQQAQESSVTGSAPAHAAVPAMMGLPRDAVVHMVGVYEGTGSGRANRSVRVVVRPSPRPLVVALSSYESVRWVIVNQGAKISAVLLSSYEPSSVIGLPYTPVQRVGGSYAYKAGSPEHMRWRQSVQQYVGPLDIRSFQGEYTGKEFSVGGF